MTKVITTSTIVLTLVAGINANKEKGIARKAPVTFDVPSQVTIDIDGADLKALEELKAVRHPVAADKVMPPEFKPPKHLPLSGKTNAEMRDEEAARKAQEESDRVAAEREEFLAEQKRLEEEAKGKKEPEKAKTTASTPAKKSAGARTKGKAPAKAAAAAPKEESKEEPKEEAGASDEGNADEDDGSNLV